VQKATAITVSIVTLSFSNIHSAPKSGNAGPVTAVCAASWGNREKKIHSSVIDART